MKNNQILFLFMVICVVIMTGCSTICLSGEESGDVILSQAPNVTISTSKESVVRSFGTGEWQYKMNEEQQGAYEACGPYPPDGHYEEGINILANDGGEIKVTFDNKPDSVKVTLWEMDFSGEEASHSEAQVLENVEEKDGSWYFKVPEDKTVVCEVYAKWERETYSGNSSYCVMVVPES